MEPMDAETLSMAILPMETLCHVFLYLPTLKLMRCRRVCSMWRSVVDVITRSDEFWRRRCERDHPSVYKQARTKSPDLTWKNLYRSLHLWTKLKESIATWTNLFSSGQCEIASTYLYKDSLVIHSGNQIFYYDKDISTLKKQIQIGEYYFFRENDHVACYLNSSGDDWRTMTDLTIIPKSKGELLLMNKFIVYDICNYEIIGTDVYYTKFIRNILCVAKCSDNYNSTGLINAPLPIWGLSCYDDCLYVMLEGYQIYKMANNILGYVRDEGNFFGTLKYGFRSEVLEDIKGIEMDYGERFNLANLMGVNYNISCMISYNKFIFTGSDEGLLHVYDADDLALGRDVNLKPIVEYNIAEIFDLEEALSICSIDVLERENGHTVYVSTVKKVMKLDLTH